MEFGDSPQKPGLKQRFLKAIDPEARREAAERKRADIQDTIAARRSKIASEQERRRAIREGKRSNGVGSYVGSIIREKRESAKVRGLEEKMDPSLKKTRKIDRDIKGIETRQKWRKRMTRVDNAFDTINMGLDKVQGFTSGGKRKGASSNMFGVSDADMRELSGLGGGSGFGGGFGMGGDTPKRKSSTKRGMVPIYQGSRIVGYSQGAGRRKARKAKKSPWDIDVGF